jgi:4,4'-diaponeurosporenoate glycosyltransferase
VTAWFVALVATGWLGGWLLAGRRHDLGPGAGAPSDRTPRVSVVVPARDEALRLPRLLACLRAASPRPDEVVVVDDRSTDATAHLARASGARVLRVDAPAGWTGKAWACWRGAQVASGDVLVFLDADTEPTPGAIGALARCAAARDGIVSVQPWHRVERPYERLSAWCNVVAVIGAGTGGPRGRRVWRRPAVFGPAVAVARDTYFGIGGHEAVRHDVAEDLALARRADECGAPVVSFTGGASLRFRMYPEGPARLVEGWSKNLVAGAGSLPPVRLAVAVAWVTGSLAAALSAVGGAGSLLSGGAVVASSVALVPYVAYALQAFVLMRRVGRFGAGTAALYVVPLAAFVAFFARASLLVAARRPVRWRGRVVPAGRS